MHSMPNKQRVNVQKFESGTVALEVRATESEVEVAHRSRVLLAFGNKWVAIFSIVQVDYIVV